MNMSALIRDWHRHEWDADYGLDGVRMLMGCPLWGKGYVDHFLAYCAPSLRANQLDDAALVLFVDGPAKRLLSGLEIGAAKVQIRLLPESIVHGLYAEPGHKYPLLAAAHNLLIHQAGKAGAGFHMLVADAVYSDSYFDNLSRLAEEHQAIAHTGFAIVGETGLPELENWRVRDAGVISIPAQCLGELGWGHLNPQWASWTMDNVPDDFSMMPNSHYIHWRARDHVRIHCAHQSAAWIGPERCKKVEPGLGGTIDSELPRYMAGDFYTPQLADQMTYIVIAGASEPTPRIPFDAFKREFWRFIGDNRAFLPYFTNYVAVPVDPDDTAPTDRELDERLAQLMAALEEGRA